MTFQPIIGVAPDCAARAVGGPYGWLTPYVARLAANNAGLSGRLLMLTREELHFIALTVSLMGEARDDGERLASLARVLGCKPRAAIFADFTPGADPALARLVKKLAGRPWRPPAYRRLAALWAEPHARKVLAHLPRISRRETATLARLPAPFRARGVLKMIKRPRDVVEVLFAIEIVRRVRADLSDRQIIASLERTDNEHIRDWVMRHYERVPFPPAPTAALIIDGVDALRPLRTYTDIARAAREFGNCIRSYLWRILRGDGFFYRYAPDGRGVAIVELRRAPVIGWVVHEALGPRNAPVGAAERIAILAAFRRAGVGAAPQAVDRNAWFDID